MKKSTLKLLIKQVIKECVAQKTTDQNHEFDNGRHSTMNAVNIAEEGEWDSPEDKIYTDVNEWSLDNVDDRTNKYIGEPLVNYGFTYKVGMVVPPKEGYRAMAMKLWNDAKKRKNENLRMGRPAGQFQEENVNEMSGMEGLGLATAGFAVGTMIWRSFKDLIIKLIGNQKLKNLPLTPTNIDSLCSYLTVGKKYDDTKIETLKTEIKSRISNGTIKNIKDLVDYAEDRISEQLPPKLKEMTSTGAVAGYSTPYAFSKKNSMGSGKAIKAAKKYGKVVKSISETEK